MGAVVAFWRFYRRLQMPQSTSLTAERSSASLTIMTAVIIGVARIFAAGCTLSLPQKVMTFLVIVLQYTPYRPKLTTRTLPAL